MNITHDNIGNGQSRFAVTLTHDELATAKKAVIKKYQQELDIKGFRKGKIPEHVVIQKIGDVALTEEAVERKLPDIIETAGKEHQIEIYGRPDIRIEKISSDGPVELSITCTRVPQVTLSTYTGLNLKARTPQPDATQRERTLKEIQRMHAKEAKIVRPAKNGDKAVVTFNAFMDNIPLEGGKAEKHPLMLGEKTFIPGFEDAIVGMKPGEKKKFKLAFPKDYHQKHLAGREAEFDTTLEDLFSVALPELNDEFAKQLGNFKTIQELNAQIDANLLAEAQQKEHERFELELVKKLIEKNSFEPIPQTMIDDETDRMVHELEHAVTRDGAKFNDYLTSIKKTRDDLKKEFKPRAEERIKIALLLRKIADEKKLHATEEEITASLKKEKEHYAHDPKILEYLGSESYRSHVANTMTSQHVLRFLKEHNTHKT